MEKLTRNFQNPGESSIEQRAYLEPMNEELRIEATQTCARFCEAVPDAVLMGGMALRFQYESKTKQLMFGTGKGDYDFYVPNSRIEELATTPPDGYRAKEEGEFMQPGKTFEPSHRALEDQLNFSHIDLFGISEQRPFETITIDGKIIRVLTVSELVADQAGILARDLTRNGKVEERRKYYASKLQEIIALTQDTNEIDSAWKKEIVRMETAIIAATTRLKNTSETMFAEKVMRALKDAVTQGDKNAEEILTSLNDLDTTDPVFPQKLEAIILEKRLAQYRRGWRDLITNPE